MTPAKVRALSAAAVGLGAILAWQIVVPVLVERAPPPLAVSAASASGRALTRAAEAELTAGRVEAAEAAAVRALQAEPFNPAALRVLGIVAGRRGQADRADDLVTLAGNWSLRDGPAHGWLVERRLQQGDYASAFAHADTLMRRKAELRPPLFELMAVAVATDPRALAPVAERLSHRPPWRGPFLDGLPADPAGLDAAARLALALKSGPAPLTGAEQGRLLTRLVAARRFGAAADLHARLAGGGPAAWPYDGGFDGRDGPEPFRWMLDGGAGSTVEIAEDGAGRSALRVEYDGYGAPRLVRQLVALTPGRWRIEGRWRAETAVPAGRLAWTVACADDGRVLARAAQPAASAGLDWRPFAADFEAPASGCEAQWLQLRPDPGNRRGRMVVWYDGVSFSSRGAAAAG